MNRNGRAIQPARMKAGIAEHAALALILLSGGPAER
jgi:hypothetical protein